MMVALIVMVAVFSMVSVVSIVGWKRAAYDCLMAEGDAKAMVRKAEDDAAKARAELNSVMPFIHNALQPFADAGKDLRRYTTIHRVSGLTPGRLVFPIFPEVRIEAEPWQSYAMRPPRTAELPMEQYVLRVSLIVPPESISRSDWSDAMLIALGSVMLRDAVTEYRDQHKDKVPTQTA